MITAKRKNTRLVFIAGAILSFILIANAGISIYLLRQNTINERSGQLTNLTLILAEHATQTMFSANTMLNSMMDVIDAANIETKEQFDAFASQKEQFEILTEKTNSNSIIDVTTFVADDGRVLNFSRQYPPPKIDLSDRDYFQWLSKHDDNETFYSLPVQNKGNGNWVFYLAKRVVNSKNEFLGLVLVGVSVKVFTELYQRIGENLGQGSGLALYRNDKTLLIRWPTVDKMIGKINTTLPIQAFLDDQKQRHTIFFYDQPSFSENKASPDRMISVQKLDKYPLMVISSMTSELYLSGWTKSSIGILYATFFSLLIVIVGMTLLIRSYLHNQKVQYLAEHDNLTALPNRVLLEDRMNHALALAKRNHKKFALMYVDLDNLKAINDSLGHDMGDSILRASGKRMLSCIRETDTVSRVGGDEFVILLYDIENDLSAIRIAENILLELNKDIIISEHALKISASIGIAIYPDHGQNIATLKKHADTAMYKGKKMGRNQVNVYGSV